MIIIQSVKHTFGTLISERENIPVLLYDFNRSRSCFFLIDISLIKRYDKETHRKIVIL